MESKGIFPEIKITPMDILKAIGNIAFGLLRQLPESGYSPTHHGAEIMLDEQIFDHPTHSKELPYRHIPRID